MTGLNTLGEGREDLVDSEDDAEQGLLTEEELTNLWAKIRNNRYHQVEELFSSGVPAAVKDENGNTALHISCQNGSKRMVKVCLRWGANINSTNKQGQTPLHFCFAYNYDKVAAYLISKGADDTKLNHFGYSCYDGLRPEDHQVAEDLLRKNIQGVTPARLQQLLGAD